MMAFTSKRGQVTIFIIVGILVLSVVALIFYLRASPVEQTAPQALPQEVRAVKFYVQECLENVAEDALTVVGRQGGYYKPEDSQALFTEFLPAITYINQSRELELVQQHLAVPYYYHLGAVMVPEEEIIKKELEKYIAENLGRCTNNFAPFVKTGLRIYEKEPSISVSLTSKISFKAEYPLKIFSREDRQITEFVDFAAEKNLNLRQILAIISRIIEKQKARGDAVIVADIAELAELYDFTYEIDYLSRDNVVYLFHFPRRADNGKQNEEMRNRDDVQNEDYIFSYAAKYDWADDLTYFDEYLSVRKEEIIEEITIEETNEEVINY